MRKVQIGMVKPGDKVAKPIFQENGNVLLGEGVELNDRYIDRLCNLGIDFLFIEDGMTADIIPEDAIREETRKQAVDTIYKTMNSFKDQTVSKGRTIAPDMGRNFRAVFGQIMQDLATRPNMLVNLSSIHAMDGYLFQHSFNVAVLAGIMGIAKGFNRNQLEELGIGALLFDIGMTKVPAKLLNQTRAFTAEEHKVVEAHAKDGFDILRKYHDISIVSAHCALQHHERYNGSGYPRGLKENDIHIFGQIVGLADTFDALTSPRPYRKRYTANEAIEFLFAAGGTFFDLDLIKLFCRHISIYPVATSLLLSTGQVGVVTENNELAVHRPRVRIIMEANGTMPAEPYELELKDELYITIVKEL
ncbi:HD-GYP domain-containing protein (c-di-GMP phosphodiesterase class II) [Paenibacillus endophyticus]|uniref:HD-GYP domain-containing protein (C-di-GMP phosphodiesterase class II) n=1 Tax=Paenibacillus endophyticus TaxID=1294268 RepID=A0A7W5G9Q0_9BACL|nr:HD-GYP domain-containing protein [Paenibacillus endophyticus]MBB3152409.1 HD-GYP domain-containing protein (c-di-GMP phosphodiesterase class II) [Paenibacillus endophyticus]